MKDEKWKVAEFLTILYHLLSVPFLVNSLSGLLVNLLSLVRVCSVSLV
jgi:hypothetical protein